MLVSASPAGNPTRGICKEPPSRARTERARGTRARPSSELERSWRRGRRGGSRRSGFASAERPQGPRAGGKGGGGEEREGRSRGARWGCEWVCVWGGVENEGNETTFSFLPLPRLSGSALQPGSSKAAYHPWPAPWPAEVPLQSASASRLPGSDLLRAPPARAPGIARLRVPGKVSGARYLSPGLPGARALGELRDHRCFVPRPRPGAVSWGSPENLASQCVLSGLIFLQSSGCFPFLPSCPPLFPPSPWNQQLSAFSLCNPTWRASPLQISAPLSFSPGRAHWPGGLAGLRLGRRLHSGPAGCGAARGARATQT